MKLSQQIKDLFPVSKLEIIQNAFDAAFKDSVIEDVLLIAGGLSSALVYSVMVNKKKYLLKITMHTGEYNDPKREYACMRIAADHIIAPYVYYSNDGDAVVITDFITAIPISQGFSTHDELIISLAKSINSIHSLPLFPTYINFLDEVNSFIERFNDSNMFSESVTAKHRSYFKQIMKVYPCLEKDIVSSHNDLNYGNILFDGKKIWIIDWDTAFANDRYVDLSLASVSFIKNIKHEELFLEAYFGTELNNYHRARFFIMQQVGLMYYAMLMLQLANSNTPKGHKHNADMSLPTLTDFYSLLAGGQMSLDTYEGKLQYGKILLNVMLKNMQSHRFEESLNLIK